MLCLRFSRCSSPGLLTRRCSRRTSRTFPMPSTIANSCPLSRGAVPTSKRSKGSPHRLQSPRRRLRNRKPNPRPTTFLNSPLLMLRRPISRENVRVFSALRIYSVLYSYFICDCTRILLAPLQTPLNRERLGRSVAAKSLEESSFFFAGAGLCRSERHQSEQVVARPQAQASPQTPRVNRCSCRKFP